MSLEEKGAAQRAGNEQMSQQPDKPTSYWNYDAPDGSEAASLDQQSVTPSPGYIAASSVATQDQLREHVGAWQVPNLAAAPAAPGRGSPRAARRPRLRSILALLALVALLGIAGSASGFGFSVLTHSRGQTTRPAATAGLTQVGSPSPVPSRRPTPTPHPSPTPTNTPSPTPLPQGVILAQDDFVRADQQFWGTASDGSIWAGDANASPVFSVADGTGRMQGGQGFFNAILGPRAADEEVFYSGTVSHFDQTRDNLGAVLRWTDNNHYYKAYIDGASLILIKRSAGGVTRLAAVPFAAQDGVSYSLRFRVAGTQLFVRVWPSAGPEPGTWMLTATDGTLTLGFGGLRALLEPGITETVTRFQERSIA